ncbi:hypothetical protein C8Q77DRAFT_122705 [Trametes polyzona]|nr:hypothetical protein C8Q77DRAFT_122705 [Trametes polyzona]
MSTFASTSEPSLRQLPNHAHQSPLCQDPSGPGCTPPNPMNTCRHVRDGTRLNCGVSIGDPQSPPENSWPPEIGPWQECSEVVRDYHEAMVQRWKEEIDTLLVYAGLFSAVLTAFNVELYSALQPDPVDTTNALLAQMAAQLNSFTLNPTFANSTQPFVPLPPQSSFRAASSSVWINALWFSSLICSLSSACIGMMAKQWLHAMELGLSGTSRDIARLRQYRLDALQKWRVGMIVSLLPILLLLASALFLAGLITLLWTLHHGIALIASVLVGILWTLALVTTITPAFSTDCAYRSPQALALFLLVQASCRLYSGLLRILRHPVYLKTDSSRLCKLISRILDTITLAKWGDYRSWSAMERAVVEDRKFTLDQHTLEVTHAAVLDDTFTERVLRPCLGSLPPRHAHKCFQRIHEDRVHHTGGHHDSQSAVDTAVSLALDVADLYLKGVENSYAQLNLDSLAADLWALPYNMVSAVVSERLYGVLVKMLQRGGGGDKCEYMVYSMLDGLTSTKWFLGTLSDVSCGAAMRDVIDELEARSVSAPSTSVYGPARDGHRELVTFLGTCYLRPGFAPDADRDFVRARLESAILSLGRYLVKPGWKNKWEAWLLVVEFTPVLVELRTRLPDLLVRCVAGAMEEAARSLMSEPEVCDADWTAGLGLSRRALEDAANQLASLRTRMAVEREDSGTRP